MLENKYQEQFVKSTILDDEKLFDEFKSNMQPIGKLSPERVLKVYATDFKYRMLEALKGNFETVWMVLGDSAFEEIVFKYIKEFPSNSYDLNGYGKTFSMFLEKEEISEELPFLKDLASFECAFWKTFHSNSPLNLSIEDFNQEEILNSHFSFSDHTQLLKFEYNVFPLFKYKDKTLDAFLAENERSLVLQDAYYLLYKKDFKIICYELSLAQYNFFNKCSENKTILEVLNQSEDATEDDVTNVFKLISQDLLRDLVRIKVI